MLAATGPVHAVVFGATPSIVIVELLYLPCMYQTTLPTVAVGADNDQPLGAAEPLVGVVNDGGVLIVWLCSW